MRASHTKTGIPLTLLLIGLVLSAVNMRSPIVMIGSVAPTFYDALKLSPAHIGYLGALPMPLFAVGALIAPRFASRFGLETMMLMMTALLTLSVASRVWFGVSGLFVGTFFLSFAIGMLNALTAPFIKKHAPNHIALATGVFSLSMSLFAGVSAWVVIPMMTVVSWQIALSSWALFGILTVMIWQWVKNHTPTISPAQSNTQAPPFNPWRNKDAWYLGVFMGIQSFLFYSVASFLPSIGIGYGLTDTAASELALTFQVVAPLAIFLLTFLIKRNLSIRLIAISSAALNVIGTAGLIWLPNWLHLWSAVMGFGGAAIFTLSLMLFSMRTHHFGSARDLSGMAQAVGYAVAFFGPLGLGKLFELSQSWQLPLYVLFGAMVVNVGFGYLAGSGDKVDGPQKQIDGKF
ncbi:MAG: MFS transporter [Moraxella sp.]|nr:MFS transporter [Moraxella sp.]